MAELRIDRRRLPLRSRNVLWQTLKTLAFLMMGIRGVVPGVELTFFMTYVPDDDSVHVVGSPLREAVPGCLAADEAEKPNADQDLESISSATVCTAEEFVHVARRRVLAEKLDVLRKEVTVVTPHVSFEIFQRVLGQRPRTIVGYDSSLFTTAVELFGDAREIIELRILRDCGANSWLPFLEDMYRYYRAKLGSEDVLDRPTPSRDART